jgi:protease II
MQRPQHRRELERYLNAENRHADTVKRTLRPLQRTIAAELRRDEMVTVQGRWDESEIVDGWEYTTAHGVTTRRRAQGGPMEVLLDENSLSAGVTVTAMQCSPSHEYFCWLEKENGHEAGRLFLKHLRSNRIQSVRSFLSLF